jgi:hypothetical protein
VSNRISTFFNPGPGSSVSPILSKLATEDEKKVIGKWILKSRT